MYTASWEVGKLKWVAEDHTFAYATSEKSYGGDVLLHVELYVGANGSTFEGHKPGDLVLFHTRMNIGYNQVVKEWKWK